MSGINPISFKKMKSERKRKICKLSKHSIYDKMQKQQLSEYFLKYIKPKGK